jgi:hypothetical protein
MVCYKPAAPRLLEAHRLHDDDSIHRLGDCIKKVRRLGVKGIQLREKIVKVETV